MPFASVLNEDFADGTLEAGVSLLGAPNTPAGTVYLNGGSQGIDIDGILTQAVLDDFELNIHGGGTGAPNYNTGIVYLANAQEVGVVDYALYIVKAATGDATYSLRRAGIGTQVYTEVASFGLTSDLDAGVLGTLRHVAGTWGYFIDGVQVGADYVGADDWVLSSNKQSYRLTSGTWEIDRIDFGTGGNTADTEAPVQQVAPALDYGKHYPRVPMHFADAVTANVVCAAIILPHGSAVPTRDQVEAGTDNTDVDVGAGRKYLATLASDVLDYAEFTEAAITRETIYAFARDTNDPPNRTALYVIDKPALGVAPSGGDEEMLIFETTIASIVSQSNGLAQFSLADVDLRDLGDSQLPGSVALMIHKPANKKNFVGASVTDYDAQGGAFDQLISASMHSVDYVLEPNDVVKAFFTLPAFKAVLGAQSIQETTIDESARAFLGQGVAQENTLEQITLNGVRIAKNGVEGIYDGTVANNTPPSTLGFELSEGVAVDGQYVGSMVKLLSGNLAGTPLKITNTNATTNFATCVLFEGGGILPLAPTVGADYKIA